MTQKVAMTFLRGWGVYNANDTAGFDADQAAKLEEAKIAVKAKDQPPAKDLVTLQLAMPDLRHTPEFQAAMAEIEAASAELDRRETAVLEREAELDARADALDAREAALAALPSGKVTGAEEIDEDGVVLEKGDEPAAEPAAKPAGLPKQGKG